MTKDEILEYLHKTIQRIKAPLAGHTAHNIKVFLDPLIVEEIAHRVQLHANSHQSDVKMAAFVAFWIRKLKPISYDLNSPDRIKNINELAAILVGTAICRHGLKQTGKTAPPLSVDFLEEWSDSFRYNAHSPHSCALTFEMAFR